MPKDYLSDREKVIKEASKIAKKSKSRIAVLWKKTQIYIATEYKENDELRPGFLCLIDVNGKEK